MTSLKDSIKQFIGNLRKHLVNAVDTLFTTIASAIIGPIIGLIKKTWIFLKQGYKSLKEAIDYIKNPSNKNKPLSILMLEIGKIITAGLTVGGAIVLGQVIEKGLMTIPIFATPIPALGSLASILGIFFGAVGAGILGAIVLNRIDKAIANKQKKINLESQFHKRNEILDTQNKLIHVAIANTEQQKQKSFNDIVERHNKADEIIKEAVGNIFDEQPSNIMGRTKNDDELDNLFNDLNKL